jgi:glycosyltransferase involved in cell wall biosynthesis
MYHADLLGGVLARLAGVRVVVWGIHHSNLDAGKNLRRTIVIARVCAWLSHVVPRHIIACSERAAQVHSSLGYCARKMRVVHNCADVHQFAPDSLARTKIRAAMKIGPAETLLGMVARWDPHKDHANLIAAMERVKAVAAVPWRLVLIGAGMTPENRELTALIVAHGVEECVVLAGPRNDVPAVMNALDLHVLSSSGEAFGNVTIEAMACGVPAVVTSVGAGETIVGETGWVVPPSDPAALSQAVLLAMQEMATAESWQARRTDCRTRVVQHFSLERMINGYQLVWTAAVS